MLTQITGDIVIKALQLSCISLSRWISLWLSLTIICAIAVLFFLCVKKKKGYVIFFGLIALIITIPMLVKCSIEYTATKYALENKTWVVEVDTVEKTKIKSSKSGNGSSPSDFSETYYVYLENNGKFKVTKKEYKQFNSKDKAYVIVVKDRNGKKHVKDYIFSANEYEYLNN